MRKKPVQSRGVEPEEKYKRDYAFVYLLTYAELRVEELSNLKLTDLDLDVKRIRMMGKRMKVLTVPISNILLVTGETGGLVAISRRNGKKENACGRIAIRLLLIEIFGTGRSAND